MLSNVRMLPERPVLELLERRLELQPQGPEQGPEQAPEQAQAQAQALNLLKVHQRMPV